MSNAFPLIEHPHASEEEAKAKLVAFRDAVMKLQKEYGVGTAVLAATAEYPGENEGEQMQMGVTLACLSADLEFSTRLLGTMIRFHEVCMKAAELKDSISDN